MKLQELAKQIATEIINNFVAIAKNGESVLVLANKSCETETSIHKFLQNNSNCVYFNETCDYYKFDRYLVPFLSCFDMSDLALGRASSDEAKTILKLLLLGKKVEVLECEFYSYKATAPKSLYSLYENYFNKLNSFGLIAAKESNCSIGNSQKDLITEKDILLAKDNNQLVINVSKDTLITPLALESAKNFGINVLKRL